MPHGYLIGRARALVCLALEKTALTEITPEEAGVRSAESEDPEVGAASGMALPSGAAVAAGAVGAAPFGGLIGQKKLIHDPMMGAEGVSYRSLEDLSAAAKPGDVVLTAKPKGSIWRNFQLPTTGTEWYHAQGIVDSVPALGGPGLTMDGALDLPEDILDDVLGMDSVELEELPKKQRKAALKTLREALAKPHALTSEAGDLALSKENLLEYLDEGMTPQQIKEEEGGIKSLVSHLKPNNYDDVALLRPKIPLTPEQLQTLQSDMMTRSIQPYDRKKAVELYMKDLFVPKVKGVEKFMGNSKITCDGNVCSTTPAQAFETATERSILPGKRSADIAPADLMRSGEYELVGSKMDPSKYRLKPGMRKALPWLSRGALGGTMAAATYGAIEEPALMGAAAGAAGAYAGGQALTPKLAPMMKVPSHLEQYMFPNISSGFELTEQLMGPNAKTKGSWHLMKPLLKGGLPVALGGAALGYAGAKGLGHLYDKKLAPKMPWADKPEEPPTGLQPT